MEFTIQRITGGLWYLLNEGKVRLEWIHKVCDRAGVDCDALAVNEWHTITVPKDRLDG